MKLASLRNSAGHDAGRIHAVRVSRMTGFTVTLCNRAVDPARLVEHQIGPTCRPCKKALALA